MAQLRFLRVWRLRYSLGCTLTCFTCIVTYLIHPVSWRTPTALKTDTTPSHNNHSTSEIFMLQASSSFRNSTSLRPKDTNFGTSVYTSLRYKKIQSLKRRYDNWSTGKNHVRDAPDLRQGLDSTSGTPGEGDGKVLTHEDTPVQKPHKVHTPEDWPQFFLPRTQQQFSLKYPYLRAASQVCQPAVDMLVVTVSTPHHHLRRQAIRDTWGSVVRTRTWPGPTPHTLPRSLGLVFLLGEEGQPNPNVSEALRQESDKYGDVVQWKGLHDTYFNLSLKVLLGLKWVTEFCPRVSHVIKTDDDTFVHVPRLLQRLLSGASTDQIWGWYFTRSPAERQGKYRVSEEAYPFDVYPPHVKGGLYVLPGDAVARMVATAPYLPYNNMEDAHVTGTLARVAGLRHQPFVGEEILTPRNPSSCLFEDFSHGIFWPQMSSTDYAYNVWTVFSHPNACLAWGNY